MNPFTSVRTAFSRSAMKIAAILLSASCVTLALWAQSQQTPPPPPNNSQKQNAIGQDAQTSRPTLKVMSQLVQVDVIAKDHNGQPVTNLKQSDFSVYDNGKKQDISWFSLETDKTRNQPAPPVAPNAYSNQVEKQEGVPGNLTIILMDFLNTAPSDMVTAKNQVIKLIGKMKDQDRIALYALGGKLYILHDFTSDSGALTRAVKEYDVPESGDLRNVDAIPTNINNSVYGGDDGAISMMAHVFQTMSDFSNVDRMSTTTQTFELIAQHMVRIPGRKNLVWVSGSFPFSINLNYDAQAGYEANNFAGAGALVPGGGSGGTGGGGLGPGGSSKALPTGPEGLFDYQSGEFGADIGKAIRDMANANIAMYPVDAHGLVAPGGDYAIDSSSISGNTMEMMPIGNGGSSQAIAGNPNTLPGSMLSTNFDTMRNLADRTGGLMFASTNDLSGAVQKAMDDARVSYMIAYYPSIEDGKGKFHNIRVKVNRPGIELRYRTGYYSEPLNFDGVRDINPILREALFSPLDSTGVGMTVHASASTTAATRTLNLTMDMEQGDITFSYVDGSTVGTLKVVLAQFDIEGSEVAAETTTVKMHLTKDTYGKIRQDGLRFRRSLPIDPKAVELKIVACDDKSSAVGSVSIPLAKYFPPAQK